MRRNEYKLRWDCVTRGCFNLKQRLKFAAFAECFPGAINFSDVDGAVHVNGRTLVIEWKAVPRVPEGQARMFEAWLKHGFEIVCVAGDAETMTVQQVMHFTATKRCWQNADITYLRNFIRMWVEYAQGASRAAG